MSAVTGTTRVALLVVSGGLAPPFVIAGAICAAWSTIRSGQQLIDKGTHGENFNPFTNSESQMFCLLVLMLGVAANIINFGAMGASMRLASLAVRGRDLSNAFRIFVNVANGINGNVSGIAMLGTTIYLYNYFDDLYASDVLMHVTSMAFWTKGIFTYKTAGTIIMEAQDMAFAYLTQYLTADETSRLTNIRNEFPNDAQLIRGLNRAAKERISMKRFEQILLVTQAYEHLQTDNDGNLILPGGKPYSLTFVDSISHDDRMTYFGILNNLNPKQMERFESFRNVVNDDMNLITNLVRVVARYGMTPYQRTEHLIHFWKILNKINLPRGTSINMNDGTLVIGRAPPINLGKLCEISPPMVRFIGEHLSQVDVSSGSQWEQSITVLLSLQRHSMFTECPVTRIVQSGRASILLNSQLQISIYTLNAIPPSDLRLIFAMVGGLTPTVRSSELPDDLVRLCVRKYRLRFECQRTESVEWMQTCVQDINSLSEILTSDLQNFEKDRLFMFHYTVVNAKADKYMVEMMRFVGEKRPNDVGTMVAYSEFVVAYVENERRKINQELTHGIRTLPLNFRKSEYLVTEAKNATFENIAAMQQTLDDLLEIVRDNNMVGTGIVSTGLSGTDLVVAVRESEMKFANEISAAYHIFKHPVDPAGDYVRLANDTIRSPLRQHAIAAADHIFEHPADAAMDYVRLANETIRGDHTIFAVDHIFEHPADAARYYIRLANETIRGYDTISVADHIFEHPADAARYYVRLSNDKFQGEHTISAVVHKFEHPADAAGNYVRLANETIQGHHTISSVVHKFKHRVDAIRYYVRLARNIIRGHYNISAVDHIFEHRPDAARYYIRLAIANNRIQGEHTISAVVHKFEQPADATGNNVGLENETIRGHRHTIFAVDHIFEHGVDAEMYYDGLADEIILGHSTISAADQIFEHPVNPAGNYVRHANVRSGQYTVTLTQDGDARTVRFDSSGGVCIVRERNGIVFLCTFMPVVMPQ